MSLLKKFDLKTIMIMALCVVLLLRSCGSGEDGEKEIVNVDGKDYELLEQKVDTVVVEKTVKVPTYVPKYITKVVTETVEVEVSIDIDTLKIVEDYFAKYEVKDTLNLTYDFPKGVTDSLGQKPNPTLGYGILTDIISQNQIQSRDVDWFFQVPTVYNTTIVKELPKNEFYLGGGFGYNEQDFFGSANIGLGWKTKKQRLLLLEGGVTNDTYGELAEYNPYISLSYCIKLGK